MSGFGFGFGFGFAQHGANVNPLPPQQDAFLPTGSVVTKDGNLIVLSTDYNFILTVDGFQPLELLMSGGNEVMK